MFNPFRSPFTVRFQQVFLVNCLVLAVHLHWPNRRQFPWHWHTSPNESFAYMNKTVKHSNDHTFVGMDENLYEVVLQVKLSFGFVSNVDSHAVFFLLRLEYSKRVYQGVRVKHTVKDLLAEKRSRQTNGPRYSVSTTSSTKPLCFCPSPVSPHFIYSPKPNSAATVDILLVAQLRGRLFNKKKISSPCLHFVLWTNDAWLIHWPPVPPSLLCLGSPRALAKPICK